MLYAYYAGGWGGVRGIDPRSQNGTNGKDLEENILTSLKPPIIDQYCYVNQNYIGETLLKSIQV